MGGLHPPVGPARKPASSIPGRGLQKIYTIKVLDFFNTNQYTSAPPHSINIRRSSIRPIFVEQLDLLGQHSGNRQFR